MLPFLQTAEHPEEGPGMSSYFIYYTESSIVCLLIFTIMLVHDLLNVDRQERQIKYDNALVAFMLYFVSDAFWAAVIAGIIPRTTFTVAVTNFLNFVFMANIAYSWFEYVMAVEQTPNRNQPLNRLLVASPLIATVLALIAAWLIDPKLLIGSDNNPTAAYSIAQIAVPIIYIVASAVYALRKAREKRNPAERKTDFYLALFPVMVILSGLFQIAVMPDTPVFCFACTMLMLIFYIQSMESQISQDPLTKLNNRGQLHRYTLQENTLFREDLKTYVAMIDVNDFKRINDEYGHAEGDNALIMIADSLRRAAGSAGFPVFLARYGGDEFVIIMHCKNERGPVKLRDAVREQITLNSKKAGLPYTVTIAWGHDELSPHGEDFTECLRRADEKSYQDKAQQKAARS